MDRQTDLLDICYSSIAPSALVIFLGKLVNRGRRIGGNETVSMVYGEVGVLVAHTICRKLVHVGF